MSSKFLLFFASLMILWQPASSHAQIPMAPFEDIVDDAIEDIRSQNLFSYNDGGFFDRQSFQPASLLHQGTDGRVSIADELLYSPDSSLFPLIDYSTIVGVRGIDYMFEKHTKFSSLAQDLRMLLLTLALTEKNNQLIQSQADSSDDKGDISEQIKADLPILIFADRTGFAASNIPGSNPSFLSGLGTFLEKFQYNGNTMAY
jgi:hypothetical protein